MTMLAEEITEDRQAIRDFTDRLREWLGLDPLYYDPVELQPERFAEEIELPSYGFGPSSGAGWFGDAPGAVRSREETKQISVDRAMRKKERGH